MHSIYVNDQDVYEENDVILAYVTNTMRSSAVSSDYHEQVIPHGIGPGFARNRRSVKRLQLHVATILNIHKPDREAASSAAEDPQPCVLCQASPRRNAHIQRHHRPSEHRRFLLLALCLTIANLSSRWLSLPASRPALRRSTSSAGWAGRPSSSSDKAASDTRLTPSRTTSQTSSPSRSRLTCMSSSCPARPRYLTQL